ncbi:MAG: hypothetical protein IPF99_11985 [Deltaproteobacteria bacterium]|nr:hypothetical protein [Deltaproteobacteria bacterium]
MWITHRPANSSTLGQWSAPAQLSGGGFDVVPFTSGIPYVAFDRFSTSAGGWLSWDQSSDLQTHVAPIAWNGSMYEITGVHALRNSPVGWPLVTETQIRSSPILQFEGADLLFFGTAIAGNTQCAFWQWHMYSGGGFFNNINTTFGPGSSFRYSGAASSLNFFQYGTAGVVVQNP